MNKIRHSMLPAVLALLASASAVAQPTLTEPKARISDETIARDQQSYETLQARIKALNDTGRPLGDYHLAKAQCWLDASWHEYTRNDRGGFPQGAMNESVRLLDAIEKGMSPLPLATPHINDAPRLRPDLWTRIETLKARPAFACAAQQLACAEVELVHAGNEHAQGQWRRARPYVHNVEALLADATKQAEACSAGR